MDVILGGGLITTPAQNAIEGEVQAAPVAADVSAAVLAGMPRNAGVIFHEAADAGWDVRAERRWTGRTWARVVVITGLVMVRAGVEEREHVCAWSEDKGSYLGSVSTDGFKAIREAVKGTCPVNREHESTGRTVWGRDAAEWVQQMDSAVSKVTAAFVDARDVFNALNGSTDTGARAVALASAGYSEARDAERSAVDAVKAARAWLVETNSADARGCASWRRAVELAGQHIKKAAERVTDATARAEREALAAPIIAEAQERLCAREAAWRSGLAESGREPTARGYGELVVMFEDAARDWCAWFDGYTDYQGQMHAGNGDAGLSFVAQYDAWSISRNSERRVSFPSRFTTAALMAGDRLDTAAVAFTLAVVDRIEGRDGERLREAAVAVRKNPQGFHTANDRKSLANWSKYPHNSYGEPTRLAEHAPAEWAALQTAHSAYQGVKDFEAALYWDALYAGERADARRNAVETGRQGAESAGTDPDVTVTGGESPQEEPSAAQVQIPGDRVDADTRKAENEGASVVAPEPAVDAPAEEVPSFVANVTLPAVVVTDRSWWVDCYGQWTMDTLRVKDAPRAVLKFARLAAEAGWSIALRAGNHDVDDETSIGVWEVEATGRCYDNMAGGRRDAVLSAMWVQKKDGGRWTFDSERSVAEIGDRVLTGIVTLEDYEHGARVARPEHPAPEETVKAADLSESVSTSEPAPAEVPVAQLEPLCTVRLPNGVLGRVMSVEGETVQVSVSSAVPRDAIAFAAADLERVDDIPRLYVTDDIVYVNGAGYKVAKRLGTDRVLVFERDEDGEQRSFAVDEVTLAADMSPVVHEQLATGWWRLTYDGRVFLSANLPDSLARGMLATLCNLTVDESGEMVGRAFGAPGADSAFYWYAARPGVPSPRITWWGPMKGATRLPPMSEEERAYMAAGPQETPARRAENKTAKSPEREQDMPAPKVRDITFVGDRGRERAEILGHTYRIGMLAGTYDVVHVASGEEVCRYEKSRPAMKRAILADAVQRGQEQQGVVARVAPSAEVVETVPEQPVSEYGWEQYGQRFAVGDVVRNRHPRMNGSTGVVMSVRERGDGEQIAGVRWGKNPVPYEQWSGQLVSVPVTVVERGEETRPLTAFTAPDPDVEDVVDAEIVEEAEEQSQGTARPKVVVVDFKGGPEADPMIQQVSGGGNKADEGMWWARTAEGITGRHDSGGLGLGSSMCETREDAEALAAWHLAGRVGPYPTDRGGAFAVLPPTVAVEWTADFNEHEYQITCAQCARVETVTGPLGHGPTAAKRRAEVRDQAIAAGLEHAAQHADTDDNEQVEDDASAAPVVVFIASQNTRPARMRVLWRVNRAEAMAICSDDRSSGRNHMLCWTADPGQEGEDWEFAKDTGSYDALLAELGITPARTWVPVSEETTADTTEIPVEVPAGSEVEDSTPADTAEPSVQRQSLARDAAAAEREAGSGLPIPEYVRALQLDLNGYRWGVECDRHGGAPLRIQGEYKTREEAEGHAHLHAYDHPKPAEDDLTPEETEAAAALAFSSKQLEILGYADQGWLCENVTGFYVPEQRESWKPKSFAAKRVITLYRAGLLTLYRRGEELRREIRLSDAGETALALWGRARRQEAVEPAAEDNTFGVSAAQIRTYKTLKQQAAEQELETAAAPVDTAEKPVEAAAGSGAEDSTPADTGEALAKKEKQVAHEMAHRINEEQRRAVWRMAGERIQEQRKQKSSLPEPPAPAVADGESIEPMNPGWGQEWWLFREVHGYGYEVQRWSGGWYGMARLEEWTGVGGAKIPGGLVPVTEGGCATAEELLDLCREQGRQRAYKDPAARLLERMTQQTADVWISQDPIPNPNDPEWSDPVLKTVLVPVEKLLCDAHIARDGSEVKATEKLTLGGRAWDLCEEHAEKFAGFLVEALGEPGADADTAEIPAEAPAGEEVEEFPPADTDENDDQDDEEPVEDAADGTVQPSVMLCGAVPGYSWDDARDALRSAGYQVVGRADESTVLLILGERGEHAAKKLQDAHERGIPCMDVRAPGRFRDAVRSGQFEGGDPLPEPVKTGLVGMTDRERNRAIREWAWAQGYRVTARGRLSARIKEAYERAHEDGPEQLARAA
ncbi:histone-like nucleoid-structuring protein Lsr2 [Streptomyces klenkii]|uniref:Lsr2 family DNA-binding protein n=1 Tax=Streptomyces klenkii TaxID=1420899 RepID=UPI00340145DD